MLIVTLFHRLMTIYYTLMQWVGSRMNFMNETISDGYDGRGMLNVQLKPLATQVVTSSYA